MVTSKPAPVARTGTVWPCPIVMQFIQFAHKACCRDTRAQEVIYCVHLGLDQGQKHCHWIQAMVCWSLWTLLRCQVSSGVMALGMTAQSTQEGIPMCMELVHSQSCSWDCHHFSERISLCCLKKAWITYVKTISGPNSFCTFEMNKRKRSLYVMPN